jgi:hypothetical protein
VEAAARCGCIGSKVWRRSGRLDRMLTIIEELKGEGKR